MNIQQLITLFKSQADCEEYISAKGNRCFRTYGSENWYYLLCRKCGITPKHTESGLLMTAEGDGYTLEWCEHDVILAIDKQLNTMKNKFRYRGETFTPMVDVPFDAYKLIRPRKAYVDESGGYTIRGFFESLSAQIELSYGACYFRSSKGKVYFPCYEGLYEMQPK